MPKLERRQTLARYVAAGRGQGQEIRFGDPSDAREMPVLILRGGKAVRQEALERRTAQRPCPRRLNGAKLDVYLLEVTDIRGGRANDSRRRVNRDVGRRPHHARLDTHASVRGG